MTLVGNEEEYDKDKGLSTSSSGPSGRGLTDIDDTSIRSSDSNLSSVAASKQTRVSTSLDSSGSSRHLGDSKDRSASEVSEEVTR